MTKTPETMTREELLQYITGLKSMIHGLQEQMKKALEVIAQQHAARIIAERRAS